MFQNNEIAFAVVTFYPRWHSGGLRSIMETDKIRGDLALLFVQKACKLGYRVVVADSSSPHTFTRELSRIAGAILIRRRSKKRSPAKRQAIRRAFKLPGIKVIILTEGEKVSLIDSVEKIARPIYSEKSDIVVPKRTKKLFHKTYPGYMYRSELLGNKRYNHILRSYKLLSPLEPDLDMFFGPRAFSNKPEIVALFLKSFKLKKRFRIRHDHFDAEDYSNTLFFPVVQALQKKIRVKSLKIPFEYPLLQKQNEELACRDVFFEKRALQKKHLLSELERFLNGGYKKI